MKFNNKNVQVGKNVKLGKDVRLGDNTIIYDNVTLGEGTVIANNCVVGEPNSNYYTDENYSNNETFIGAHCLIRSHTIIYAGNVLGDHVTTGHFVLFREKNVLGEHVAVGSYSELWGECKIGRYSRISSAVMAGERTEMGDFVMVYPFAIFPNSPTPPSQLLTPSRIGDYTVVAVSAVILPGVNIGKNCLVGANATVTKDFGDYCFIVGSPAKRLGDVREIDSREKEGKHYPWMLNFDRGMPWKGMGYENWLKTRP